MVKYKLSNGIKVYYYQLPHTYSTALSLCIDTGVKDETEDNNGITHLLEHLHFCKLGDWEKEEIYYNMNKIGSTLNGSTYKELLKFSMKVRPQYFFEALEFFSRILSTYDWSEQHLQEEKQVVLNEIYSKESYMSISPYVDELVWKNSALSKPILGKIEVIENITLDQITSYKKQCFCSGKIAMIITGNISEDYIKSAIDILEKIEVNKFPAKSVNQDNTSITMFDRKSDIKFINCSWDYVDVSISFDINNGNIAEAALVNSIIGGGIGSLLPNVIREELGLVYDISSRIDLYNEKSVLNIEFSTAKKNIYRCLEEIVIILNRVKKKITSKDILSNITYFTENQWYLLEDPEELNSEMCWEAFLNKSSAFSVEKKIKAYKKPSKRMLMDFAKNTFVSRNSVVAILGNTSKITKKAVKEIIVELDNECV